MRSDEAIFADVYPALRRLAAAVSNSEVDPDDLVQEALVRALRRGPLSDLSDAQSYLSRVVVNVARNGYRDRVRRSAILSRFAPSIARRHVDSYPSDLSELDSLSVEQRAVLYLRLVDRRETADIARVLGLTEEAVRARASRGLKTLRIQSSEWTTADGYH